MKKIYRILAIALAVTSLCTNSWSVRAEDKLENRQQEKTFMQAKLVHTQNILAGLLTENFNEIVKHAQKMSLLTQALSWQMLEAKEYTQRSKDFRHSVDQLTQAAKKKDLNEASLGYIEITIKCFQCHQYVRKVRRSPLHPLKK